MELCPSCFPACTATLFSDVIDEDAIDQVMDAENSVHAIKACLLMTHNKNDVLIIQMKS